MMREQKKSTYMVRDLENEFMIKAEGQSKSEAIYQRLLKITDKGNHAEVKRRKDGSLVIYEVKKKIIM
jgi:hypothetical protein